MLNAVFNDPLTFLFDEDKNVSVTVTDEDGASLSAATATILIKDSAGATVLSATAMTGSGTTSRLFTYLLNTGSAVTITAAGLYSVTVTVTHGSQHYSWERTLTVLASAYPSGLFGLTSGDLINFLIAAGLISNPPTEAQSLLDFQGALDAAIEDFKTRTGRSTLVKDSSDVAHTFDPPGPNNQSARGGSIIGGGRILQLDDGLLTFTSLVVEGVTYTQNEQFTLMPTTAGNGGKPYEWVEFTYPVWGRRRQIVVTGKWGIATSLPADLKRALLCGAALFVLPQVAAILSQGLQSLKLGQDTWVWNANGAYAREGTLWQSLYESAINRYRLVRL